MNTKVSIVIPAYNAGRSLARTLESVLGQTYKDIEVWITDDGSADETGAVADAFALRDGRVHVIHQENRGCYQARLCALRRISTSYFTFADADDIVEPNWIERMMEVLVRENLDAVECQFFGAPKCDGSLRVIGEDGINQYKFDYLVNSKVACFVWNKLYRNQFDFGAFELTDRNTNFEDLIFNLQFFRKIRRIGFLNLGLYHYETVAGSAVHSFGSRQKHDFMWMVRNHWRLTKELFPNGEYSKLKLWIGHRKWFWRNIRNVMIMSLKARIAGR